MKPYKSPKTRIINYMQEQHLLAESAEKITVSIYSGSSLIQPIYPQGKQRNIWDESYEETGLN